MDREGEGRGRDWWTVWFEELMGGWEVRGGIDREGMAKTVDGHRHRRQEAARCATPRHRSTR